MRIRFLCLIILVTEPLDGVAEKWTQGRESNYVTQLISQSREMGLSKHPYWDILLHYKGSDGKKISEIDDPRFFLSSTGKTDPSKELEATLKNFFVETNPDEEETSSQCRFVARFKWLKDQLQFDERKMKILDCAEYLDWIDETNPKGVTLIFASYFLNVPASMFGHTFLRIDSSSNKGFPLLDDSINYSALIDEDESPLSYAVKGIFGRYKGVFTLAPYYLLARSYNDFEQRDLWEYELDLDEKELERMMMHLWELRSTWFEYYFFSENCSYHLLALLEAARPTLGLQQSFKALTIPIDTVKKITAIPGFVKQINFRPSALSKFQARLLELSESEREVYNQVVAGDLFIESKQWKSFTDSKKAVILDTVIDFFSINEDEDFKSRRDDLLILRAELGIVTPELQIHKKSPDKGHHSSRIGITFIDTKNSPDSLGISIRPTIHDLLGKDEGFIPWSQLELLHLEVRQSTDGDRGFSLQKFVLADVISLRGINEAPAGISWKINAGIYRTEHFECEHCRLFDLTGGIGLGVKLFRGIGFSFLELKYYNGTRIKEEGQFDLGFNFGYLGRIAEDWKVLLEKTDYLSPFSSNTFRFKETVGIAYSFQKNMELRIQAKRLNKDEDYQVGFYQYF